LTGASAVFRAAELSNLSRAVSIIAMFLSAQALSRVTGSSSERPSGVSS